jgi:hypothetical protein
MAHYIRYEIYLPTRYRDASGNLVSVEMSGVKDLLDSIAQKYGGFTQSNPISAPPFRGFWEGETDEINLIMVLVPSSELDTSLAEFTSWKEELESKYNQQFILVMYSPIQTIGEF